MSSVPPFDERDQLAAEYALGVLDGADLANAARLATFTTGWIFRSGGAFRARRTIAAAVTGPLGSAILTLTRGPCVFAIARGTGVVAASSTRRAWAGSATRVAPAAIAAITRASAVWWFHGKSIAAHDVDDKPSARRGKCLC